MTLRPFKALPTFYVKLQSNYKTREKINMKTEFTIWSVCALSIFKEHPYLQTNVQIPYS